jgi:hypothetical protein
LNIKAVPVVLGQDTLADHSHLRQPLNVPRAHENDAVERVMGLEDVFLRLEQARDALGLPFRQPRRLPAGIGNTGRNPIIS